MYFQNSTYQGKTYEGHQFKQDNFRFQATFLIEEISEKRCFLHQKISVGLDYTALPLTRHLRSYILSPIFLQHFFHLSNGFVKALKYLASILLTVISVKKEMFSKLIFLLLRVGGCGTVSSKLKEETGMSTVFRILCQTQKQTHALIFFFVFHAFFQ